MKLKTKKSLAKRIKITKTGKLKKRRTHQSHLMWKKSKKRKRKMAKTQTIFKGESQTIRRLLPYS
ncbi:50S ribosomal protein L35 [Candidatus Microgenomates bacterium]|nr:50S ribosomal protein L35 [Candidatus Microgenomates bacterium]